MTQEMAKRAWGQEMPLTGYELPGVAATTIEIHECGQRRFILQNGSATRFVDSR